MSFLDDIFGFRSRPLWTERDFRQLIPGNEGIKVAAREAYAAKNFNPAGDRFTEVPIAQYSSPYGPLRINISRGISVKGKHYLVSRVVGARDSTTGEPLNAEVEGVTELSGSDASEHEVFLAARRLYLAAYMHEAEENFRWNGERILDPHDESKLKDAP